MSGWVVVFIIYELDILRVFAMIKIYKLNGHGDVVLGQKKTAMVSIFDLHRDIVFSKHECK